MFSATTASNSPSHPSFHPQTLPRRRLLAAAVMAACAAAGSAARAADPADATPFDLGTVTIVGQRGSQVGDVGQDQVSSVVTRADMERFNRDDVGDALNLLSGVTLSTNSRNEKTIAVRGFDARQAPLFIDGIPVYVPYDGYIDFNRFTTADLAEIQVAKGYSSMAYGPNTLGGAINLVSRKPRQNLEADASAGVGSGGERRASANVGSNQGLWYVQAGSSYVQADSFPLSSSFQPTATENGGMRDNAYRKDNKVSLKLGLTPSGSDEYALSYYQQNGVKGQPPSTDPTVARYWKWPFWDKESLYFISRTGLGQFETLKLRLYHDSYDNETDTYTDDTYSVLKTSGAGSVGTGRSIYHDKTDGGSVELESTRLHDNTLRLVAHYKADQHHESDANDFTTAIFKDALSSYALEDNLALAPDLSLAMGAGEQQLRPVSVYSVGNPYSLPSTKRADDAQAALFYDWSPSARVYVSAAGKTRLPTLKDRYSQRLGTFLQNPDLQPERSNNYEVGYQGRPWNGIKADAALYYSDISNKIQTVANVSGNLSQQQNVGKVHASGLEAGLSGQLVSWLEWGGNYSYIDLKNISAPGTKLTDVPRQKLVAYALLRPRARVELSAYVEHNSGRWESNTLELAGFTTLNLKVAYTLSKQVELEAGLNNVTDRNYELADGFPSAGRTWFANANYHY
jgi:iron complex outermembrane receptor protein